MHKLIYGIILGTALTIFTACGAKNTVGEAVTDGYMQEAVAAPGEYMGEAVYEEASYASKAANIFGPDMEGEAKIIRNIYMDMEVKEIESGISDIKEEVKSYAGYIESFEEGNLSMEDGKYAYFHVRIPTKDIETFITGLKLLGNVTHSSENSQNITSTYYDTQGRKKSLEAERERVLVLLEKAENIEDILAIESKLSDLNYQIEDYERSLKTYDNQVEYTSVQINISQVIDYTKTTQTIGERIVDEFIRTWTGIKEFCVDVLVSIAVYSPVILAISIIVLLIYLRRRRR